MSFLFLIIQVNRNCPFFFQAPAGVFDELYDLVSDMSPYFGLLVVSDTIDEMKELLLERFFCRNKKPDVIALLGNEPEFTVGIILRDDPLVVALDCLGQIVQTEALLVPDNPQLPHLFRCQPTYCNVRHSVIAEA